VSALAGRAVWALAPYAPEAPFRLYPGPVARAPVVAREVAPLRNALAKGGDAEVTTLTPAKVRPVLIVADASDTAYDPGLLVLRLLSFDKLSKAECEQVRAGTDPRHFHLRPARFKGLPQENAAIVSTLTRVATSAIEPGSLGLLDANELRVLHERIVAYFQLDLGAMVKRMVAQRIAEAGGRGSPPK
jgi:hypothetical protein